MLAGVLRNHGSNVAHSVIPYRTVLSPFDHLQTQLAAEADELRSEATQ